jgi:stage III sporulation protein SpoIIIAA
MVNPQRFTSSPSNASVTNLPTPIAPNPPQTETNLIHQETQVVDDLEQLMAMLPLHILAAIQAHPDAERLVEVVMDLGRRPEARFPSGAEYLSEEVITKADLQYCVDRVGMFSGDNRAGIERTLHRISAMRNRTGDIVGLTCRVGRAIYGTIGMIRDLVETGQSILMLGRPGVGKTTALREIARILADELNKRVVIIDSSNEVAGDGDVPHPAIGRARRMQVSRPELQHQVMIEAVENHMPEVIIIDEIGTELEALAARTIAERGVQLIGTAHGNQIENLIKNPTLSDLVGGIQSVTLGDDEARRRGSQKTVLERKAPPTFEIAVEMLERQRWVVHESVSASVDTLLRGRKPTPQVRTVSPEGKVIITHELPDSGTGNGNSSYTHAPMGGAEFGTSGGGGGSSKVQPIGWRAAGQMTAVPGGASARSGRHLSAAPDPMEKSFAEMLDDSFSPSRAGVYGTELVPGAQEDDEVMSVGRSVGPNGEDLPLHIYPYAVSRHFIEQLISSMNLPVVLTKDISGADAVLALRTHLKSHSKLRQMARTHHVPVHAIKSNTMPQILRALRRLLDMEDLSVPEEADLTLFGSSSNDDELEALEEARLAIEQIVLLKGQPVELLPRSATVRKIQYELVEHYRLKATSFGDEPNRRLRIYPA